MEYAQSLEELGEIYEVQNARPLTSLEELIEDTLRKTRGHYMKDVEPLIKEAIEEAEPRGYNYPKMFSELFNWKWGGKVKIPLIPKLLSTLAQLEARRGKLICGEHAYRLKNILEKGREEFERRGYSLEVQMEDLPISTFLYAVIEVISKLLGSKPDARAPAHAGVLIRLRPRNINGDLVEILYSTIGFLRKGNIIRIQTSQSEPYYQSFIADPWVRALIGIPYRPI